MNAQQLKNSILQEAIEGRLVPQDPNDEPASVLLERIREEKKRLVKEGKLKKKDLEETPISEDEKPFEIPESWEWVRIPDIGISQLGKTKNPHQLSGKNMPYLCSINVYWEGINLGQTKEMMFEESELDKYTIRKGDLLICEGGDCGRSAIWDKENTILYQNALHRVRFFCDIESKYILNCIYLYKATSQLDDYIKGETIKHLVKGELDSILFPLPPLAEQKRIVAKIEDLLPKVEVYGKAQDALDKLNAELPERLKKSILQEAIEGRLVPQDPNDEPASILLDKIRAEKAKLVKEGKLKKKDLEETPIQEDEIPFDIPESWEWVRLGSVISLLSGRDLAPGDYNDTEIGIPYITGASNFDDGALIINRWTPKPVVISKCGDLLITCKGTIGTMAFNEIGEIHIARQVMALSSYLIDIRYIQFFLTRIVYELDKKAKSIIPGISREDILTALFPLPPLAEQKRIVAKIEQLLGEIDKLK